MKISVVTAPAAEPVTLAEAKASLRVTYSDEDDTIGDLITVARELCEAYQGRAFIQRTLRRTLDAFPGAGIGIALPYPPLISIVSIKYDDEDGTEQTLAADQYQVDPTEEPARVRLAPGVGSWPNTELQAVGAVRIDYLAGYGTTGAEVPAAARRAVLIKVADLFENRESIAPGNVNELGSVSAEALLSIDRVSYQGDGP